MATESGVKAGIQVPAIDYALSTGEANDVNAAFMVLSGGRYIPHPTRQTTSTPSSVDRELPDG
jgi:hypothetical protein